MSIASTNVSSSRLARLAALLLVGSACTPPAGPLTFSTNVRYLDVDGMERVDGTMVSAVSTPQGCESRLEFNDPSARPPWALHQIGGSPPLTTFTDASCHPPPGFVETAMANRSFFLQQTLYYWLFEARAYAVERFWLPTSRIGLASTRLDASLTSDSEHNTACYAPPPFPISDACMRDWGHEGPRVFVRANAIGASVFPRDLIHEYGHYAAGYVFGYMDTAGLNGYDITQCAHRGFQETLADLFAALFFHARTPPTTIAADGAGGTARWIGGCAPDDHNTGAPLVEAVRQSLLGGGPTHATWMPDDANRIMADAIHHALTLNQGHDIGALASGVLERIRTQAPAFHPAVVDIFQAHGFGAELGDACVTNRNCQACSNGNCLLGRCDTTMPPQRCIPPDGTGQPGVYCTHRNHCISGNCNLAARQCN